MKFTSLQTVAAVVALGLHVCGRAHSENEVDLRGGFGYDSNAFELNPVIGEREGIYAELDATVSAEGKAAKGWTKRGDIGATARLFESGMSDADEGRAYIRARGDSSEKYSEHGWGWSLRTQLRDQTYVSRLTGLVATDASGNDIGDRYDSHASDLRAGWRLPGGRFGRLSLEGSALYKNYEQDYEQFGLERLDYYEYGLTPEYQLGGRDRHLRIRLPGEQRKYRDRRISNAAGDPLPGTNLEYRSYGIDARYRHPISRRSTLELTGGYDIREDNGVDYAGRTQWNAGIEWTWRHAGRSRLAIEAQYNSRVLDQQVTGDPTVNDEVPEKKGFDVTVRYARPFPFLDIRGFSLVAEARWESYDNNDDIRFTYDRLIGSIGIRQEF